MDGQKLGWKNEQELGNSSQVGGKGVFWRIGRG